MEFIDEKLSEYAEIHSSAEPALLKQLNRDTHANVMSPRMLSGHLQGRFLSLLSHLMRPRQILEIGTYTGYSALSLAEGLAEKGVLHTIDINEELEERTRKYFDASDYSSKIIYHIGNALTIIPTLQGPFDVVFIDADKENYSTYYDLVIDKMPSGGLLIADNVLWSGKVTDAAALTKDNTTKLLDAFNKKVSSDDRMEVVLVPIRDGLLLARRK
ncbi:MAG: O-methyltransferase [Bacteroidia bacterium]